MKKKGDGLKFLGKEDLLIGIALLMLSWVTFKMSGFNVLLQATGIIVLILGLILVGFGASDYLRD